MSKQGPLHCFSRPYAYFGPCQVPGKHRRWFRKFKEQGGRVKIIMAHCRVNLHLWSWKWDPGPLSEDSCELLSSSWWTWRCRSPSKLTQLFCYQNSQGAILLKCAKLESWPYEDSVQLLWTNLLSRTVLQHFSSFARFYLHNCRGPKRIKRSRKQPLQSCPEENPAFCSICKNNDSQWKWIYQRCSRTWWLRFWGHPSRLSFLPRTSFHRCDCSTTVIWSHQQSTFSETLTPEAMTTSHLLTGTLWSKPYGTDWSAVLSHPAL